jgi:tetratricopeptide (TPR) repeat protein
MTSAARCAGVLAACLALSSAAGASWWDVWQAESSFELEAARELALATIIEDPYSADAVAAAYWWLANLDDLREPEEILTVATNGRDPELGFVYERIASTLTTQPPAGALTTAEVAGAFGVFSTLDLERSVVPPDRDLPPLGTRWQNEARPFRLLMRTPVGHQGPPESMIADGVYLVAWTLEAEHEIDGWVVVEARGGYNLELDERPIDRRRHCGQLDPSVVWYRIHLSGGLHRLRLELASTDSPQIRVCLVDDRGAALQGVELANAGDGGWSESKIRGELPPASAGLRDRLQAGDGSVPDLLLAAQLAAGRGDPKDAGRWIDRARETDPQSPWVALALARLLMADGGGEPGAELVRSVSQLLRDAAEVPGSRLYEQQLAMSEGRTEDAERVLDRLMADYADDPRVMRVWVREAVRRGWAREAAEGLALLETELPGSPGVTGLRLEVLASLERWRDRDQLLRALAAATPVEPRWISQLASSCLVGDAVAATETLQPGVDEPDFDVQLVRLELESGNFEAAALELERARSRWGDLQVFDGLDLLLAGGDRQALDEALAGALERDPSNLQLLTLAWRLGQEAFFESFAVDGREFAGRHLDLGTDVDAVLLLDQAVERIFTDGSSVYYYHGLTRANTPVGARRASVLQPLPDAYLLSVRILKPDGRVVVPADLRPGNAGVVLSDVEVGDVVEEEYVAHVAATGASRDGHLPPYLYRFADSDRAFGLSEYILLVPPEIDLQVDGNFEGLDRSEVMWRGLRMLDWRAEKVPPMPTEPFAPPAQELMPWLNYGFGVSWQDVGDAVRDRVLSIMQSSSELDDWSRQVLQGQTPEEQLQSLVQALVEKVEAGGNDLSVETSAGDSFARRNGNRLGIVATVLADAGWQVDLVLTRPLNERDERLRVPTLDAFPVALLRVTDEGQEIWFDPRQEVRGVGRVNALFQGSDGLVLPLTDPAEPVTFIEEIPAFPNPDLVEEITVRAVVDSTGGAQIAFVMPLRGGQAARLRDMMESVPEDQVRMLYRQMATSLFTGADTVDGTIEDTEGVATIHMNITVPGACDAEDGTLTCRSLVLAQPLVPILASLPDRRYPLVLQLPIERRLTLEIVPPAGWQLTDRPPRQLEADWGSVSETLQPIDGSLQSVLSIRLPAQTVAQEDYRRFARFCQAVDELTTRPPRLQPVD